MKTPLILACLAGLGLIGFGTIRQTQATAVQTSGSDLPMELVVTSIYDFKKTVNKIQEATGENGFSVLHVHSVSDILSGHGFEREPITIVEICNARIADTILKEDIRVAVQIPCPVVIYQEGAQVKVMTYNPRLLQEHYPSPKMPLVAEEATATLENILGSVTK